MTEKKVPSAGANAICIPAPDSSNVQVSTGTTGAGSFVVNGEFAIRVNGTGGGVFGPNVHGWNLNATPVR